MFLMQSMIRSINPRINNNATKLDLEAFETLNLSKIGFLDNKLLFFQQGESIFDPKNTLFINLNLTETQQEIFENLNIMNPLIERVTPNCFSIRAENSSDIFLFQFNTIIRAKMRHMNNVNPRLASTRNESQGITPTVENVATKVENSFTFQMISIENVSNLEESWKKYEDGSVLVQGMQTIVITTENGEQIFDFSKKLNGEYDLILDNEEFVDIDDETQKRTYGFGVFAIKTDEQGDIVDERSFIIFPEHNDVLEVEVKR